MMNQSKSTTSTGSLDGLGLARSVLDAGPGFLLAVATGGTAALAAGPGLLEFLEW